MVYLRRFFLPGNFFQILLAFASLIIISIYTFAFFVEIPYIGFEIEFPNAIVSKIFIPDENSDSLMVGDKIISFGSVDWSNFSKEKNALRSFPQVQAGQVITIKILRNGSQLTTEWEIPGINLPELVNRLTENWYLAYVFWIFAVLTLFLIRPRDRLWRLMAAFFFSVGLWLGAGFASYGGVWYSAIMMRILTWVMAAVSLHFHWNFPKPFFRPHPIFKYLLYISAGILISLELFLWIPANSYLIGISFAVLGSLGMLVIHLLFFTQNRQRSHLLLIGVAVLLIVGVQISTIFYSQAILTKFTLLFSPLLPMVYFYSVYSNQMGGLEFRYNRLISLMVFTIIVFLISGALIAASHLTKQPDALALVAIIAITAAAVSTASLYPSFHRWFERNFLGLPQISPDLLTSYTTLLVDNLEIKNIAKIMVEHLFPSLLIRQALVFRINADSHQPNQRSNQVIVQMGVPNESNLSIEEIMKNEPGQPINAFHVHDPTHNSWIRLFVPLRAGNKMIGGCLLGRRDPDDIYSSSELPLLQALMDQTALAILHVEQSANLRAFHQADILRQEEERKRLARILHDEVLGQMTVMALNADQVPNNSQLQQAYQSSVENIRSLISGLRPSSLNFGLQVGLEDCRDFFYNQIKQHPGHPEIILSLDGDGFIRYSAETEIQLFRIVQQACYNAIQHAEAKKISIIANFAPDQISLHIKDDGCGFDVPITTDISGLLEKRHYGLVGMLERAALIQAELKIVSGLDMGTEVSVVWHK